MAFKKSRPKEKRYNAFLSDLKDFSSKDITLCLFDNFNINKLLKKVCKGKTKSIDRKLEDKFNLDGIPLIIAKKDCNGIGGMTTKIAETNNDKICIIAGGDGGGGKSYYCNFDFAATSFVLITDFINEAKEMDKYAKFYLSVVVSERLYKTIGHGRTISDVPAITIKLPVNKDKSLNIEYMSNFIKLLPFSEFI